MGISDRKNQPQPSSTTEKASTSNSLSVASVPLGGAMKSKLEIHDNLARLTSRAMYGVCIACTFIILGVLVLVTGYLISIGFQSLSWYFFTQDPIPLGLPGAPGGMRNAILGTIILLFAASIIGVPIGMLTGIYLSEYEVVSWLTRPVRFICDMLTGVPSIVVGVLGYELLVAPAAA